MADVVGRRARWTAGLLLVPGAAAIFSGAVAWATHARPATFVPAQDTTASTRQPVGSTTAAFAAELTQLRQRQAVLDKLTRQLAQLQARLGLSSTSRTTGSSTIGGGAGQAARSGGSGGSGSGTRSTTGGSSAGTAASGPGSVAVAPPAPVVQSSAPPPVQTTTGASGVVK